MLSTRFARISSVVAIVLIGGIAASIALRKPSIPQKLESSVSTSDQETVEAYFNAMNAKNEEKAYQILVNLERANPHPTSKMFLGAHHATGINGLYREDYCRAAQWYDQAARSGNLYSMIVMSVYYMAGQGVEVSAPNAVYWYEKAKETPPTGDQWPPYDYERILKSLEVLIKSKNGFEAARDNKLTQAPLFVAKVIPDLPYASETIGPLYYNSRGCHGDRAREFYLIDAAKVPIQKNDGNQQPWLRHPSTAHVGPVL